MQSSPATITEFFHRSQRVDRKTNNLETFIGECCDYVWSVWTSSPKLESLPIYRVRKAMINGTAPPFSTFHDSLRESLKQIWIFNFIICSKLRCLRPLAGEFLISFEAPFFSTERDLFRANIISVFYWCPVVIKKRASGRSLLGELLWIILVLAVKASDIKIVNSPLNALFIFLIPRVN